jgi:hypothetical protein
MLENVVFFAAFSMNKARVMKRTSQNLAVGIFFCFMLQGCAGTPPSAPGSKEEAVDLAWKKYCETGYCEGYSGRIVNRTADTLTVMINGNTRYIRYSVSGSPGNYNASVMAKR